MSGSIRTIGPCIDAVVQLTERQAPPSVRTWYHVTWRGLSRWVAYSQIRSRAGWRHWYEQFPSLRQAPYELMREAMRSISLRGGDWPDAWKALQREPTPAELLDFTDSATWPHGLSNQFPLHCPTCHWEWVLPDDRAWHTRNHRRIYAELREAFTLAGLPDYNPDEYERWKSDARGVFNGYDGHEHTAAERLDAATRYLRVQCCQSAHRAVVHDGWAGWRRVYPDFAAWVRSEHAHYAHEFDAAISAAIIAEYGPVLTREEYEERNAAYMRVHAAPGLSDRAKTRELDSIADTYAQRLASRAPAPASDAEGGEL